MLILFGTFMYHVLAGYVADALEEYANSICGVNVVVVGESVQVRWAGCLSDPTSGCRSTIHI
jgi:hypothetical protein